MTEDYAKLVRLVTNDEYMSGLNYYFDQRIEKLKQSLVYAAPSEVVGLQSTIKELILLKRLKETILAERNKDGK